MGQGWGRQTPAGAAETPSAQNQQSSDSESTLPDEAGTDLADIKLAPENQEKPAFLTRKAAMKECKADYNRMMICMIDSKPWEFGTCKDLEKIFTDCVDTKTGKRDLVDFSSAFSLGSLFQSDNKEVVGEDKKSRVPSE